MAEKENLFKGSVDPKVFAEANRAVASLRGLGVGCDQAARIVLTNMEESRTLWLTHSKGERPLKMSKPDEDEDVTQVQSVKERIWELESTLDRERGQHREIVAALKHEKIHSADLRDKLAAAEEEINGWVERTAEADKRFNDWLERAEGYRANLAAVEDQRWELNWLGHLVQGRADGTTPTYADAMTVKEIMSRMDSIGYEIKLLTNPEGNDAETEVNPESPIDTPVWVQDNDTVRLPGWGDISCDDVIPSCDWTTSGSEPVCEDAWHEHYAEVHAGRPVRS